MRKSRLAMLTVTASVVACLLIAGIGGAITPARAASRTPRFLPYIIPWGLLGVTAISADDAWAVGASNTFDPIQKTVILHWNGKKWAQVTDPKPVYGMLWGVSAVSADNVWAVGETSNANGSDLKTLIMHWNGKAWSRNTGVPVVAKGYLNAVTASASGVWAVGQTGGKASLILHYTGGHWHVVPTREPKSVDLDGVAATGSKAAWAVGNLDTSSVAGSFLYRWNGSLWNPVSFPFQKGDFNVNGIATGPSGAAWAVGEELNPATRVDTPISMRLTGTTWRKVSVPGPKNTLLGGVTFVPGGTALAVGAGNGSEDAMVLLRWTGAAWTPMKSSVHIVSGYPVEVNSVAATSPSNAWAVGAIVSGLGWDNLILHWNGKIWS